jgi:hypothetical protein
MREENDALSTSGVTMSAEREIRMSPLSGEEGAMFLHINIRAVVHLDAFLR